MLLLEKGADILCGASKGNSAILHTGLDAPPGSLEVACMQAGYEKYMVIAPRMNLPVLETGAIVAAWNDEELAKLDGIEAQARQNGVTDVRRVTREEILQREPHINPGVRAGELNLSLRTASPDFVSILLIWRRNARQGVRLRGSGRVSKVRFAPARLRGEKRLSR